MKTIGCDKCQALYAANTSRTIRTRSELGDAKPGELGWQTAGCILVYRLSAQARPVFTHAVCSKAQQTESAQSNVKTQLFFHETAKHRPVARHARANDKLTRLRSHTRSRRGSTQQAISDRRKTGTTLRFKRCPPLTKCACPTNRPPACRLTVPFLRSRYSRSVGKRGEERHRAFDPVRRVRLRVPREGPGARLFRRYLDHQDKVCAVASG